MLPAQVTQWPGHARDRILQRSARRDETADPGGDGWDRTRDFTSLPCRAQPREPPFKEEKASTVFSGSFFLLVTLDTVPLSTAPRAFSWGGKEGTKSTKCIWGGERSGGSFGKTAGQMVLSGDGNAKKLLGVRRGRRGRGGAEKPVAAQSCLTRPRPPGQSLRLSKVSCSLSSSSWHSSSHLVLAAGPRALCLASCPCRTHPVPSLDTSLGRGSKNKIKNTVPSSCNTT